MAPIAVTYPTMAIATTSAATIRAAILRLNPTDAHYSKIFEGDQEPCAVFTAWWQMGNSDHGFLQW